MMDINHYAVIMAGGIGSRFWPISTSDYPKQFHDMLGSGRTLLQKTFDRLSGFIPKENILVLTNAMYFDLVHQQLPDLHLENVVSEPCMRNTAPCILYAAMKIKQKNPNAVMIVAPSDHWIENEIAFISDVKACFEAAKTSDILMTLGIVPTFPNTGYGYIQYEKQTQRHIKKVNKFREKPDYETAKSFLNERNFLWNAGIFVWSVSSVLKAFEKYQPVLFALFEAGNQYYNTSSEADFIKEQYPKAENISVDYAILEPSDNIFVYPAHFDWNDLGTWGSLHEKLPKDEQQNATVNAQVLFKSAKNNIVRTENKKIVIIDELDDYIVVDKEEVLLIYPKYKEQQIKEILNEVKVKFGDHLG
ncbi:GDP-mannose pyrophosphorylase [Capnocytophaga canimorsus Cc5]|uniref:mannose-1-phosphate guanylyltransferase n=2 Tax=Capnocytophaga canimorsus TaxID=28188 RepID=F9YTR0_CAPCC|nr:GDP-mannose pyrophosphorylase [Capnocytophaga canimorsus Cc5]CEN45667.1 GDP-mannose pyrophosphorylase [Capnocytophaga canimorsus]VEJ19144.1 Mannose-1-phosphate guanylyltransferase rfbM [Capnocytophaga canimorsus]